MAKLERIEQKTKETLVQVEYTKVSGEECHYITYCIGGNLCLEFVPIAVSDMKQS